MQKKHLKGIVSIVSLILIIVLLFSALYLYTGNWPPAVIVESKSMQHGNNFVFGVINTGDIVAVKKITGYKAVDTYLVAREHGGPTNYGEYGDVIVYDNHFLNELVIHRAIFYVYGWVGDVPELYGNDNPSWLDINGSTVYIYNVGYAHRNVAINLQSYIGQTGFVTMGDYNLANSELKYNGFYIAADQDVGIDNSLVNYTQVYGVAVGYLPVLGVMKLWITGNTQYIPEESNEIMAIIIVLVVALIFVPFPSQEKRKRNQNE